MSAVESPADELLRVARQLCREYRGRDIDGLYALGSAVARVDEASAAPDARAELVGPWQGVKAEAFVTAALVAASTSRGIEQIELTETALRRAIAHGARLALAEKPTKLEQGAYGSGAKEIAVTRLVLSLERGLDLDACAEACPDCSGSVHTDPIANTSSFVHERGCPSKPNKPPGPAIANTGNRA